MTQNVPRREPPRSSVAAEPVVLTALQKQQAEGFDNPLPDFKPLSQSETHALGGEALEAYFYGERTRWDTPGKKWVFLREQADNAFRLAIRCSVGPVVLAEATMPLDRIASKEGEEAVIALVERLSAEATSAAKALNAYQKKQMA